MTCNRIIESKNKEWCTPKKYVDAVKEVFGGKICLDPCSNKYSIVGAETEYILPIHDGLKETWNFSTIFINPPYGINKENKTKIKDWLRKCAYAHKNFNSEIIALIPVATNTSHWKEYIFGQAASICFLYDTRLRFLIEGKEQGKGAPMACSMIYYYNGNIDRFSNVFCKFGYVVNIQN